MSQKRNGQSPRRKLGMVQSKLLKSRDIDHRAQLSEALFRGTNSDLHAILAKPESQSQNHQFQTIFTKIKYGKMLLSGTEMLQKQQSLIKLL